MYVCGATRTNFSPSSMPSTISERNRFLTAVAPASLARRLTTMKPTLWRVAAYSRPGFPNPTTIFTIWPLRDVPRSSKRALQREEPQLPAVLLYTCSSNAVCPSPRAWRWSHKGTRDEFLRHGGLGDFDHPDRGPRHFRTGPPAGDGRQAGQVNPRSPSDVV